MTYKNLLPQENDNKLLDDTTNLDDDSSLTSSYPELWEPREQASPEKMLWINVIIIFLRDTQRDYDNFKNSTNGHRQDFLNIVNDNVKLVRHPWLASIAENAGVDYEKLIKVITDISTGKMKLDIPHRGRWY